MFRNKAYLSLDNVYQRCVSLRTYITPAASQLLLLEQMETCQDSVSNALILGAYRNEDDTYDAGVYTNTARRFIEERTNGRLDAIIRQAGSLPKLGDAKIFFGGEGEKASFSAIGIVGLGKQCLGYNPYEVIDEQKEAIRRAVGKGCMELLKYEVKKISVESMGHAESAAEGAALGIWAYQELRDPKKRMVVPGIDLFAFKDEDCDIEGWRIGKHKAAAQNLTRFLQEMPPNILTPTTFAQYVIDVLCKSGVNVELKVEGWAKNQGMNALLAVCKASCEPPIFMELSYYGAKCEERPIVLIGQGITYDCGGLHLKRCDVLKDMRGDMTGAAVVVAACRAIAALKLPINVRALIPLCENVIGCNAFRPGDIIKTLNNRSVKIERTDHEDMLVLGDALLYAQNFCPKFIVDIGCTSRDMRHTLDEAACGVFTNSEILWQQIKHASMHTGDRVWRMPLWNFYSDLVKSDDGADINNMGTGRGCIPCKAAAYLREFVPCGQWMHIDVTGVMKTTGNSFEYLRKGMAGRPTRTVIELLAQTICKDTAPKVLSQASEYCVN